MERIHSFSAYLNVYFRTLRDSEVNNVLNLIVPYPSVALLFFGLAQLTEYRYLRMILSKSRKKVGIEMAEKKELRRQFEEVPIEAGVYEVQNMENKKIFIGKTPNLKTLNGMKHILNMGANNNKELQADWNHFGQEAFIFTVLEVLEKSDDPSFNEKKALEQLEEKWLHDKQPFGDHGYNRRPKA